MGTILNVCKDTRKAIKNAEKKIAEATHCTMNNGTYSLILDVKKEAEVNEAIIEARAKIESSNIGLTDNSKTRYEFKKTYEKFGEILNRTERGDKR